MNFGMIGAIGGAGQGFIDQGNFLADQEKADAAAARTKSLEDWRMRKQQEYQIQSEQRAEDRTIRTEQRTDQRQEQQKDRDFNRLQTEAPTRRGIEVENEKAKARGKSDVAAETADQDAGVASKMAEAKETTADKAVKASHAAYYNSAGEAATTRADKAGAAAKVDPADAQELKDVQASIKEKRSMIDKGRVDGSWNDDSLSPGQRKVQAELVAEQKRLQAILARNRAGAAPAAADPLGLRKGSKGPLAVGADNGNDDSPAGILGNEYRKAKIRLTAAVLPEEKERAQSDLDAIQREAKAKGITLSDTPPARAPAAPAMVGPTPAAAPNAPSAAPSPAAAGSPQQALQNLTAGGKPGAAPAGDTDTKVRKLRQRASGAAAPAGAAPAADPLMQALGATGGSSIANIVGQQAPALRAAADKIKAAQAQVTMAAKGANQQGVAQAMAQVQAASAELDALLKDMNPPQAQAVKQALGV